MIRTLFLILLSLFSLPSFAGISDAVNLTMCAVSFDAGDPRRVQFAQRAFDAMPTDVYAQNPTLLPVGADPKTAAYTAAVGASRLELEERTVQFLNVEANKRIRSFEAYSTLLMISKKGAWIVAYSRAAGVSPAEAERTWADGELAVRRQFQLNCK